MLSREVELSLIIEQQRQKIQRLEKALNLACTPPWRTSKATPGVVDTTMAGFYLRRAAEAAGTE